MKTSMAAIPAVLVGFLFQPALQPDLRAGKTVVTISPQRVLTQALEARAGVARLQEQQRQKTAELRTLQQALDNTRQQVSQATGPEARLKLTEQEKRQRSELEAAMSRAQADLQNSQQQFQAGILKELKPILDDLSKSQHFDVVLNGDTGVVWAAQGLDITESVVERLNSRPPAPAKP